MGLEGVHPTPLWRIQSIWGSVKLCHNYVHMYTLNHMGKEYHITTLNVYFSHL